MPLPFGPPLSLAWGCQRGGKIMEIPGIEPLQPGGSPGGEKGALYASRFGRSKIGNQRKRNYRVPKE